MSKTVEFQCTRSSFVALERVLIVVSFTDVVGSTEMLSAHGGLRGYHLGKQARHAGDALLGRHERAADSYF